MAFENVFGNVDFGMPVRQAEANRQHLAQMIGLGVQQAQNAQRMDLERRKLEAKEGEFNLKRTAENALMKQNMGMPISDQEQAAIRTMGQIAPPVFGTDPYGNTTMMQSGWGQFASPQRTPMTTQTNWMGDSVYDQPIQPIPMNEQQVEAAIRNDPATRTPAVSDAEFAAMKPPMIDNTQMDGYAGNPVTLNDVYEQMRPYEAPARFGARGEIMSEEFKRDTTRDLNKSALGLKEYAEKKGIDLEFATEEQKREIAFEMQKDKIKRDQEKKTSQPQELFNLDQATQEAANINSTIKDLYENANYFTTGFVGQKTKGVGGTPALDLAKNLKTLEADSGLSKLIEVKERGGTFGALQEKELELLISSRAALSQDQSPKQFKENLIKYQAQRVKTMQAMADFYKQKFGQVPEYIEADLSQNIIDPRQDLAKQGRVFTNAEGEKIVYDKKAKEWKKIQ